MNLVPVRDSHLGYISVSQIVDENPYRFRRPDLGAVETIRLSFLRSGQTHPMLLEAMDDGNFRVIDGHRRLDAVRAIYARGGFWPRVLAHVVTTHRPSALLHFLYIRNDGARGFAPTELGRLLSWAQGAGLDARAIARETKLTLAEIDDLLEIAEAPDELGALIDRTRLEPVFGAMLLRRFHAWTRTRNGPLAIGTAARIIEQSRKSHITVKGFRFLLDFYWADDRPFMIDIDRRQC